LHIDIEESSPDVRSYSAGEKIAWQKISAIYPFVRRIVFVAGNPPIRDYSRVSSSIERKFKKPP